MDNAAYRSDGEGAPVETAVVKVASGYERIKLLKKDLRQQGVKVNIPDLLALTRGNDPFYSGSESNQKIAEWFLSLIHI